MSNEAFNEDSITKDITLALATPIGRNDLLYDQYLKFENAKLCDGGWNDRNKEPEAPEEEKVEPWTTEYLDEQFTANFGQLNKFASLNKLGCICKGILDGQKPIGKLTDELAFIDEPKYKFE